VLWSCEALTQGDGEAAIGHWREVLEMASQVDQMECLVGEAELIKCKCESSFQGGAAPISGRLVQ
jgi:hypothetical protein